MNPDQPSRAEIEARLTALLLGELPDDEAKLLRWAIAQDPELKKLHDRLKLSVGLVREATAPSAETNSAENVALKLSEARRRKLLAHFKTPRPKPLFWLKPIKVSQLVPVLVAVAIVGLLAALILPNFVKARATSKSNAIINNLRQIDTAKEQWALENKKAPDAVPAMDDLKPYLSKSFPQSVAGERYVLGKVSEPAVADVDVAHANTLLGNSRRLPLSGQDRSDLRLSVNGLINENATPPPVEIAQAPVVRTVPAQPVLAPPPVRIVLPQSESASDAVAQTDTPPAAGGGGVYSHNVVGYVNVNEQPVAVRSPAPASSQVAATSTITLPAGGAVAADRLADTGSGTPVPPTFDDQQSAERLVRDAKGLYELGKVTESETKLNQALKLDAENKAAQYYFNLDRQAELARAENSESFGTHTRLAQVEKKWETPAPAVSDQNGRAVGTVNAFAGAGGLRGGGGGGSGGGGGGAGGGAAPAAGNRFGFANAGAEFEGRLGLAQNQTTAQDKFYRNPTDASEAAKVPVLGDVPMMGRLFAGGQISANAPAPAKPPAPAGAPVEAGNASHFGGIAGDLGGEAKKLPPQLDSFTVANAASFQSGFSSVTQGAAAKAGTSAAAEQDFSAVKLAVSPPLEKAEPGTSVAGAIVSDAPIRKPVASGPIPQPEIQTRANPFSTFALNVSDVAFKLAEASLQNGRLPDAASIRSEEFINAFDYRDPEAPAGVAVAFTSERARDPFSHNRDLLRFAVKTAASGRAAGRPLNLVLLLDNSGSMERADRVAIIREALRVLAAQLHPQDTVSVVTFARTARLWVDGVAGDKAGAVFDQVGGLTPQGGTNLEEAMRLAYETARRHYLAHGMNRVVLLTDGAANLGNVEPNTLKQNVNAQRQQGIALDCFGIGWEDYNDDLLELLSSSGDGRYAFLNSPADVAKEFAAKLAGALQVAAQDVKVQVEFNPQRVTAWRQIGYATHQLTKEQFRDNTVAAGTIAAQEAGNALYTVAVNSQGDGPLATVRVRYKIPGTTDIREQTWDVPYTGGAVSLEQSSAALRLAVAAGEFAEWLAASPYAQEVTPDELLKTMSGLPVIYGADPRPKQLEWMIRQAKSLAGK